MKTIDSQAKTMTAAARSLRQASGRQRNQVLDELAKLLKKNTMALVAANKVDLAQLDSQFSAAFRDRLSLDETRIGQMIASLKKVKSLPDPLGEISEQRRLKNGLKLKRVRSPLGIILMIFEARPNVVTEAFSLALKSGNCLILRGGKESLNSCRVLYSLIDKALTRASLPADCFWGIDDPSRELSQALMTQDKWIDVLVPRGGDSLIEYVVQNSTIPIIKNDRGLCHVYIHQDADVKMAVDIVVNAKTQRPGVCNSMETLLIHEKRSSLLPEIHRQLAKHSVHWYGCAKTLSLLKGSAGVSPASATSYDTEYLDYKINSRVVSSLEEALEHIATHGSRHSEAIITKSKTAATQFQNAIDAAAVYWNASTRFTDGFEFGLGGELGISTQKLHVRGPVGLRELTSLRWIIDGRGQVR